MFCSKLSESPPRTVPVCSLLAIILDSNPSQPIVRSNPDNITKILDAVIDLANAHILQRHENELVVLACHHHSTEYLYPMPIKQLGSRRQDGQFEPFNLVEKSIKQRLTHIICNAPRTSQPVESMLAGSMGMALCYIARMQRTINRMNLNSRILVVTGSDECASQYMTFMNIFFTAQKIGVVIDVCNLGKPMALMQQGCDLTKGQYLHLTQLDGLLQYFLWVFLPEPPMRQKLILPPRAPVDYRAACFCHNELIDIGYVCSACLSIFCKYKSVCTTCLSVAQVSKPLALVVRPNNDKETD